MATSEIIKDGFADIVERWSFQDVIDGNDVLDAIAVAEAKRRAREARKARHK